MDGWVALPMGAVRPAALSTALPCRGTARLSASLISGIPNATPLHPHPFVAWLGSGLGKGVGSVLGKGVMLQSVLGTDALARFQRQHPGDGEGGNTGG
jgi:hypothetical protein